jgi:hypothetical protein
MPCAPAGRAGRGDLLRSLRGPGEQPRDVCEQPLTRAGGSRGLKLHALDEAVRQTGFTAMLGSATVVDREHVRGGFRGEPPAEPVVGFEVAQDPHSAV